MLKDIMSRINHENEERSGRWEEHRDRICSLMNSAIRNSAPYQKDKNILVYGAGRCDDLDFDYLSNRFSKISLVDIDTSAVEKSVSHLNEDIKNKISILPGFDFSGLDTLDYYDNFRQLAEKGNAKNIKRYIRDTALKVKPLDPVDKTRYSVVMSTAVYTQLCYIPSLMMLIPYVSLYSKKEVNHIKEELVYITNIVVETYNKLLLRSSGPKAGIVAISDMMEVSEAMPYTNLLVKNNNQVDEDMYKSLLSQGYGLVGAEAGMKSLIKELEEGTVCTEHWIWNFSKERKFYTRGLYGVKR